MPNDTAHEISIDWPKSPEAERGLLGCLVYAYDWPHVQEALNVIAQSRIPIDGEIHSRLWFFPNHAEIFKAVLTVAEQGAKPGVVIVADELRRMGVLGEVGGAEYLIELDSWVFTYENAAFEAKRVIEAARRRQMIAAGMDLQRQDGADEWQDRLRAALTRLEEIRRQDDTGSALVGSDEVRNEALAEIESREGMERSIPFSWAKMNFSSGGMIGKRLMMFSGRYGAGKTTFANNVALGAARYILHERQGGCVVYFSTEEPRESILFMMASCCAGLDSSIWNQTPLSDSTGRLFGKIYAEKIGPLPIHLFDGKSIDLEYVTATCESVARRSPVRLVLLDYLQKLELPDMGRNAREEQRITMMVNRLADWVHSGKCPGQPCFVAMVQEDPARNESIGEQKKRQQTKIAKPRYAQSIEGASDWYAVIDRQDFLDPESWGDAAEVPVVIRPSKHRAAKGFNVPLLLHKAHGVYREEEQPGSHYGI